MRNDDTNKQETTGGKRKRRFTLVVTGFCVLAVCLTVRHFWSAEQANAEPSARSATRSTSARSTPKRTAPVRSRSTHSTSTRTAKSQAAKPATKSSIPEIVATVNGKDITREQLAQDCLRQYGVQVLERVVNKYLIEQECQKQNIRGSQREVWDEIDRLATRFKLPKDQWLKMLEQERGINPQQYAADIIWPTLALRRLAGERLKVTQEELQKAYETKYGDAVCARLIACSSEEKANKIRAMAITDPAQFGNLAKEHSEDVNSAAAKGLIQPIRKHGAVKEIEQAAFTMEDGQISPVIQAGGQYVVLKRERLLKVENPVPLEQVAPQLEELIRESKLRKVADDIFRQLQEESKVVNVLNDPRLSPQMPGIAAVINGRHITIADLAQQCVKRHGKEVLEGTISRSVIEQACAKRRIKISEKELDAEIARLASIMVRPKSDGSPDVEGWLKLVVEKQGGTVESYRSDTVWPSLALKKLVGDKIEVTEEDLERSFKANYGERVICRAIVMENQRRALSVWEKARQRQQTVTLEQLVEYFGDLAAEYSVEPGSRALRGEVPPIKQHGGQPLLEQEAFSLADGELSGVIPVGERFVIMLCVGRTKTTGVKFDQVRDLLLEDMYEKRQRMAMANLFRQLQNQAAVDNFLAGTSHRPKRQRVSKSLPSFNQMSAPPTAQQ